MLFFRSLPLSFLGVLTLVQAQKGPDHSDIHPLETYFVTAGLDGKTGFDLAQGTSILAGDELHRRAAATLGATLADTAGVSGTYFGPGASRPIIRGLGGERVRMLDNGVGSLDASSVSPDHGVSIEPLLVERIEVLRGPATLLYGSSAVGGVVNVIDNRIPSTAPAAPFSGRAELRYESAASEHTSIVSTLVGNATTAVQVNGLSSETHDVAIPGYADPAKPSHYGTLSNSARTTKNFSMGVTRFGEIGNFGVALNTYNSFYGVPVDEPICIDLKQRRVDLRGELTQPFAVFKNAKFRFGLADYTHAEIDSTSGRANTTFDNHAYEGRVELIQKNLGALSGTVGYQTTRSDFSAVGQEVVTPPSLTTSHALFALESFKITPALSLEFGARYERQRIQLGEVADDLAPYAGYDAKSGQKRTDQGLSFSTGAVYYPAKDFSIGVSLSASERIPAAQELFSHGPHGGTGAYEIGSAGLDREGSIGAELTLRRRAGFVTGSVGAFVNRFKHFVFEQRDLRRYYAEATGTFKSYPASTGETSLPIYQFLAKAALFYGAEAEVQLHLIDRSGQRLHLSLLADTVHAEQTTDHEPLPRIPAARLGLGFAYTQVKWALGAETHHTFRQTRFSPEETATAEHTLVGAHASYYLMGLKDTRMGLELFARAENLANADARLATSFLKDIAPLPGRSFTLGVRLLY
ncbi:MAG: TonB-dependent receptor [Opitutaceae bacterium]